MKRLHLGMARLGLLVIVVLSSLGQLPAASEAAPARAQAPAPAGWPFAPLTLADLGPRTTNSAALEWLGLSGDWVAYATGHIGCGHCGTYTNRITLQNMLTGDTIPITPSLRLISQDGVYEDAAAFQFAGGKLLWSQPGQPTQPTPTGGYTWYTPGTYDCTRCTYDTATGQGGAWTGGDLTPDPVGDWTVSTPQDPPPSYRHPTLVVTRTSTGEEVIHGRLSDYNDIGDVLTAPDRLIFVQSQFTPEQGGYGSPLLIRLLWLVAPDPAFARVWAQADGTPAPNKTGAWTWLWGPQPNATAWEAYADSPGGKRLVQYYDKSRMEVNNPSADPSRPGYVTNGLLVTEMIAGEIHTGDLATIQASIPCTLPVAGDPRQDNPLTPSYAILAGVASLHGEHQAPDRTGQIVTDVIDVHGTVTQGTPAHRQYYSHFIPQTGHNIPDVFWSTLITYDLSYGLDWTFVAGYPITEAYWTQMRVGGKDYAVLIQAYQRRVLTYAPNFPREWQTQQGNVGQHYLEWRTHNLINQFPCADCAP